MRSLEHAALSDGHVRAGEGMAVQRIDAGSKLRVLDAILSGTHEQGSSHYELLLTFTDDTTLQQANEALETGGYLTHEFGDSVLIERKTM